MPPIAALFVTTYASVGISALLAGGAFFSTPVLLSSAVITGLTYAIGKLNRQRGGGSEGLPLSERNVSAQRPNQPRKVVYGRATFSPVVVSSFSNDSYASLVCAIADHKLSTLHNIKFNEENFFTDDEMESLRTNGYLFVTAPESADGVSQFRKDVNERTRDIGDATTQIAFISFNFEAHPTRGKFDIAMTNLSTTFASNTDFFPFKTNGDLTPAEAQMRLTGTSWITFSFRRTSRNDNNYWDNLPSFQVDVSRNNDTLSLWPNAGTYEEGNAALAVYDFLNTYTPYGEPAGAVARLDVESAKTAASICDSGDYYANGVASLTGSPSSILEQLAYAMNSGAISERAGVRFIHAGASPSAPSLVLTEDDIMDESWSFVPTSDISSRVQTMEVRYADVDGTEQSVGVRAHTDKVSNTDTMELEFVNNQNRAEQVARIILDRMWNGATFSCKLLNMDRVPNPNDIIAFDFDQMGMNPSSFWRVVSISLNSDRTATIEGIHERPNLFEDHNVGNPVAPSRPSGTLPGVKPSRMLVGSEGTTDRLILDNPGQGEFFLLTQ